MVAPYTLSPTPLESVPIYLTFQKDVHYILSQLKYCRDQYSRSDIYKIFLILNMVTPWFHKNVF